jgi:UDP-GlcNAc:undecaprenyl-phosphate/decaprenyl-phosphate GlcNAc-1-phosphate transferase
MSFSWRDIITAAFAAGIAGAVAIHGGIGSLRPPVVTNHKGRPLPLSIGWALGAGYAVTSLNVGWDAFDKRAAAPIVWEEWLWLGVGMALVFAAGLFDDLQPSRTHGLGAHFAALARGRVTSGIVKLVAAVVAATIAVVATGAAGWNLALGIPLIAGVTNLCNLFDVAPGRALKFGFCFALVLTLVRSSTLPWATAAMTAALLPFDVHEKAMLGDAGANLLGFVLGYLLWARLSRVGMVIALAVVLLLHALAETVTLTRIIRATPPLRWLDDLWRIPAPDPSIG